MSPRTGEMYEIGAENHEAMDRLMREARLVEVPRDKARELAGMELVQRKNWMRNQACQCGSGKKFKRCCWSKFA